MTFPPSKVADKYNYDVAVYLKINGLPELGSYFDLRTADINPAPNRISAKYTLFDADISFDIIASTQPWEIFVECKHMESPTAMRKTSEDFLDAVAEFLSAMGFADIGHKVFKYLFITNANTNRLKSDIEELLRSDDDRTEEFLESVIKAAKRKWKGARTESVRTKQLRSCLLETRVITIEDGTLALAGETPEFKREEEAQRTKIGRRIPGLPLILPDSTKFALEYMNDEYIEGKWNGRQVYVSKKLVDWLAGEHIPKDRFVHIAFNDVPQKEMMKVFFSSEFSGENAMSAFSGCINSNLHENCSGIAVIVNPNRKRMIAFNPDWLYNTVKNMKDTNYRFNLTRIIQLLSFQMDYPELRMAIQESYRLVKGIEYSSDLFLIED